MKYILLALFLITSAIYGQQIIKDLTVQDLKVVSTTKGSKPCPLMTQTQINAIGSPLNGQCVYNTTTNKLNVYNGSLWKAAGGGVDSWATATVYAVNDLVIESNKIYKCLIAHTSGTFATDLAASRWIEVSAGVSSHLDLTDIGTNTHAQIDSHIADTNNPHSVTKAQVGLSNVVNTDTTTTANITDSLNKRFVTDAEKTVIGNTSGTNTGDQDLSGLVTLSTSQTITGLKQFNNSVGIGGAANANAILDVQSTTKAFLPPRMTTAQMNAIASPVEGMTVYNTDFDATASYNGTTWAYGFGNINAARLLGTIKVTGCSANWSNTSASFSSFSTQTGCTYAVTGEALAPTTNIPAIRVLNIPAGEIVLSAEGAFTVDNVAGSSSYFQFYDGTTASREEVLVTGNNSSEPTIPTIGSHSFTYNSPQSNLTFQIRSKLVSGRNNVSGTNASPLVIKIYHYPNLPVNAYASTNANYSWTPFTPISPNSSMTFSSANCSHARDGSDLLINCYGILGAGASSGSEGRMALPNSLTTASFLANKANVGLMTFGFNASLGGYVMAQPSTGYITFGIQGSGGNSQQVFSGGSLANPSPQTWTARIPIQGWSNAPFIVGSFQGYNYTAGMNNPKFCSFFVSNGAGVPNICTSASCTTQKIKGNCANSGSVTRSGAGRYLYTFPTGTWANPAGVSCQVQLVDGGNGRLWPYYGSVFSTTARNINFDNASSVGEDASFEVFCHGE